MDEFMRRIQGSVTERRQHAAAVVTGERAETGDVGLRELLDHQPVAAELMGASPESLDRGVAVDDDSPIVGPAPRALDDRHGARQGERPRERAQGAAEISERSAHEEDARAAALRPLEIAVRGLRELGERRLIEVRVASAEDERAARRDAAWHGVAGDGTIGVRPLGVPGEAPARDPGIRGVERLLAREAERALFAGLAARELNRRRSADEDLGDVGITKERGEGIVAAEFVRQPR